MLPRKRSPRTAFTAEGIFSIAIAKYVLEAHLTIAPRMATLPARQLPKMVSDRDGPFSRSSGCAEWRLTRTRPSRCNNGTTIWRTIGILGLSRSLSRPRGTATARRNGSRGASRSASAWPLAAEMQQRRPLTFCARQHPMSPPRQRSLPSTPNGDLHGSHHVECV
jgi:hypothetical protein